MTNPVIEKNGTKYIIHIGKLPGLLGLAGTILTIIVSVVLWFNSVNAFQDKTQEERRLTVQKQSSQDSILIVQGRMLIELNWNMKEILRMTHPDLKYDWRSYEEIKKILLLLN